MIMPDLIKQNERLVCFGKGVENPVEIGWGMWISSRTACLWKCLLHAQTRCCRCVSNRWR